MPIAVKCEKCGKGLKAPDTLAGKRVKCPGCGGPISVPAPAAARAPAPAVNNNINILDGLGDDDLLSGGGLGDLDKLSQAVGKSLPAAGSAPRGFDPLGPTPTSQVAPKKDRRRMLILGGSIGGGVLALVLIVVVILMLQGDSPPETMMAAATPDVAQPATTPAAQAPAATAVNKPAGSSEDLSALFDTPQAPAAGAAAPAQSPAAAAPVQPVAQAQPAAPPAQLASVTPPVVPAPIPAPVVNPPAAVQNPPGVPLDPQQKALQEKAAREQAKNSRQTYLALLSGDPQTLVDQMRWAPAAKRPILRLRWGVSLPVPQLAKAGGRPVPPKVADSEAAIVQAIGPPGTKLLSGLNERIARGDFGGPSGPVSGAPSQITVLPGDERGEVLAAARERGVDVVILIDLKFQAALHRKKKGGKGGGGPKMSATLSSRIVDVASGTPGWSSDSISNKNPADAEKNGVEWAEDNLHQIDEFKLKPVSELDAKDVEKRMTDLEKKKLANPLAALLEVRYYQIKGIVPSERATAFFTQVLGENGNLLASDDGKERQKALEKLAKP